MITNKNRHMKLKHVFSLFCFIAVFLLINFQARAQVVIAGTTFEPTFIDATKTFYGLTEVKQTGLQTGNLITNANLTTSTLAGVFNSKYQYAITDNPFKLDNAIYANWATPDYAMAFSPVTTTPTDFFEYSVNNLVPGSAVTVNVDFCSLIKTGGCVASDLGFKGGLNPDPTYGNFAKESDASKVQMGACGSYTLTGTATTLGTATFKMRAQETSACKGIALKKVEILGIPNVEIYSAQGVEVCAGEMITLQTKQTYYGTYKWEVSTNNGGSWTTASTEKALLYEVKNIQSYQFRVTVTFNSKTFTSNILTIKAIQCCEINGQPASRQTVYFDDFGRFDLKDPYTLYYTDYSDITNPVEKTKKVVDRFRYPLDNPPVDHTYAKTGPPGDDPTGQYLVGANFTTYDANHLGWAYDILGRTDSRSDHSKTPEGAMLFVNVRSTVGKVIYERTIDKLCSGKTLYFECWIAVFTTSQDEPVNITIKLSEVGNPSNVITLPNNIVSADGAKTANHGIWLRVATDITLSNSGSSLKFEILNNNPNYKNGNDLVLDDIKIMACSAPSIGVFFDLATLSKEIDVCSDQFNLVSKASDMLKNFYNKDPYYLYQWSKTPNDPLSWKNIGTPITLDNTTILDPQSHAAFTGVSEGDKVYFRVIAAASSTFASNTNFQAPNYANINDPCKNYSVSDPIEATYVCPACTEADPVTVTPTGTALSLCPGASVTLTTNTQTDATQFEAVWYKGSETAANMLGTWAQVSSTTRAVPYANADTYIVVFRDKDFPTSTSCMSKAQVVVVAKTTPPIPAPADVTICEGEDLVISSGITAPPTGTIYHWSGPGAFTASTATVTRTKALTTYSGTYSLYTEIDGCISTTDAIDVLVNPSPVTTWLTTDTTYCGTAGVTLSVNAVAGASYAWTKNGTPIPTATTASLSGALAGVYGLTLTKAGCSYTLRNITVIGNPTPVYTITGGDDYCAGETVAPVVIEFTVGSPNFSFTYTIDGTAKAVSNHTSTTYTINTPIAGIYRLTGTITDGNGCTALATTANTVVEINPLPVVTMKAVSYCSTTDNINLYNEMISSEPTNGSGVFTASAGTITGTGSGSIFKHNGVAGIYTITYTFTDDNGCSDSFSETLTINANLSPTIHCKSICCVPKDSITLATSQAFAKYTWTGTAAALLGSATTIASPTIPATAAPGNYTITVTVEDANKCTGTDTKTITIHALPTATLSSVAPLCVGDAPATITTTTSVADGVGAWTGAVFGLLIRLQPYPCYRRDFPG
ncbi:MAG: hypothetical protein IPO21_06525 [Bacteroidales bacterium]|nr:hypothetical protein [Bacteroidales bacterium]